MKFPYFKCLLAVSLLGLVSCQKSEEVPKNEIINLQVSDTSNLRADNYRTLALTATLPDDIYDEYRSVIFTTTAGVFIENNQTAFTISITSDNTAVAHLIIGSEPGICIITATIGSSIKYYTNCNLKFSRAFPDSIIGETDIGSISLSGNSKVIVTANLFRKQGDVSKGTQVIFEAHQLINNNMIAVGRFSGIENSNSNDNGIASVVFYGDTGNIQSGKQIILTLKSQNDAGIPVISMVYLNVNP